MPFRLIASSSKAIRCLTFAALSLVSAVYAQQPEIPAAPPAVKPHGPIQIDVVASAKNGSPIGGLPQSAFRLFDNNTPTPLSSFRELGGSAEPVEVILLIDAVNTSYQNVAFERGEIDKFLRRDGGHLAQPTALAVVTDTGTEIQPEFSRDGNAISNELDHGTIGLRFLRRSTGFYGAEERLDISLRALHNLTTREGTRPGRKLIVWVSPGWPLLSGPAVQLDDREQLRIFQQIVEFSTTLRQARVTLSSIDPIGVADIGFRTFYYEEFLKGVSKPSETNLGNLALQVLASQTGGLVLNSGNDTAALIAKCYADTAHYYELTFPPHPTEQPNEYHHIAVTLPNLTARTRDGYYTQP